MLSKTDIDVLLPVKLDLRHKCLKFLEHISLSLQNLTLLGWLFAANRLKLVYVSDVVV